MPARSLRSAPVQNARSPAPRSTMARVSGRSSRPVGAWRGGSRGPVGFAVGLVGVAKAGWERLDVLDRAQPLQGEQRGPATRRLAHAGGDQRPANRIGDDLSPGLRLLERAAGDDGLF